LNDQETLMTPEGLLCSFLLRGCRLLMGYTEESVFCCEKVNGNEIFVSDLKDPKV